MQPTGFGDRPDGEQWLAVKRVAILLLVASVALYLPALDYSFVADDGTYLGIRNNRLLALGTGDLWRLLTEPMNPWEYLPVRDLTYWFDARVFGVFPDGFHAMNIVWYAVTLFVVFAALRESLRWARPEDLADARISAIAALGTCLFAVHPAHVEPVVWISGRKDILAGLLVLAGWMLTVRAMKPDGATRLLIWAGMCLAAAFFAKSTAVAGGMLIAVFVAAIAVHRRCKGLPIRRELAFAAALGLMVAVAVLIHLDVARRTGIAMANDPGIIERIERASRILAGHLEILFVPADLRLFHDAYSIGWWHWVASALALAAAAWSVAALARGSHRLVALATLWLLLPIAPYLQWQPFSTWSMISERFVYLSTFGLVLLALAALLALRRPLAVSIALASVVVYAATTSLRIPDWSDERALAEREYRLNPGFFGSARIAVGYASGAGDWTTAEAIIAGVRRDDARELLRQLVRHEKTSRKFPSAKEGSPYCLSLSEMDRTLKVQFERMTRERDIAYNSFLRNAALGVYPVQEIASACRIARTT
jgi:hypothetical protein